MWGHLLGYFPKQPLFCTPIPDPPPIHRRLVRQLLRWALRLVYKYTLNVKQELRWRWPP